MDSTKIASNIVIVSRLQLTLEAIQRLHNLLSETGRARYAELLAPYVGETAGHYVYRVKGFAAPEAQLRPVGQALYQMPQALAASYGQEPAYRVAARLFAEQYRVEIETAQAKANQEISASSLQSLDDLEATDREKNLVFPPLAAYMLRFSWQAAPFFRGSNAEFPLDFRGHLTQGRKPC